jgi:hypothetical protein
VEKKMELIKKNAADYKKACKLTDDFFCEYNPNEPRVLQFIPAKGLEPKAARDDANLMRPCCVAVSSVENAETRQQDLLKRLATISKRLARFYETIFLKVYDEKTNLTIKFDDEEDKKSFIESVDQLQLRAHDISERIVACQKPLFSKHLVSFDQLPVDVCEPMQSIIENLEHAFFPRMFQFERVILERSEAERKKKLQEKSKRWFNIVLAKLSSFIRKLASGVKKLFTFVSWVTSGALRMFAQVSHDNLAAILNTYCSVTTKRSAQVVPFYGRLYVFYEMMYYVIKRIFAADSWGLKKLRQFMNFVGGPQARKFYMEIVVKATEKIINQDDANEEKKLLEEDKDETDRKKAYMAKLQADATARLKDLVSIDPKAIEPKLSDEQIWTWVWSWCVYSFEMMGQLLSVLGEYSCLAMEKLLTWLPYHTVQETATEDQKEEPNESEVEEDADKTDEAEEEADQTESEEEEEEADREFSPAEVKAAETNLKNNLQPPAADEVQKEIEAKQIVSEVPIVSKLEDDVFLDVGLQLALPKNRIQTKDFTAPNNVSLETIARLQTQAQKQQEDVDKIKAEETYSAKLANGAVSALVTFFWYATKSNAVPVEDIEDDLLQYEDIKKDAEIEPMPPHIEDFVRFAYCKAQTEFNDDECLKMVQTSELIFGRPNNDVKYRQYVDQAQEEFNRKQEALMNLSETGIRNLLIEKILEDNEVNNQNLQATARPELPAARPELPAARPVLPASRPVLPASRPVLPASRPVLPASRPVLPASRPVLPASRPVLPVARPVLPEGRPIGLVP